MGAHRDRHQRSDLDIDQLFAPEPESRAAAPALIFTQPADRNLQLFPDEPVDFAEERILVPDQSIEPVAQPYRPRWKRRAAGGSVVLRVFVGSSALVVGLAIALAVMQPNDGGDGVGDWLAKPARIPSSSTRGTSCRSSGLNASINHCSARGPNPST